MNSGVLRVARGGYACRTPGPPERARTEPGGADPQALKQREFPGFASVIKVTSESMGCPLTVFELTVFESIKKLYSQNQTYQWPRSARRPGRVTGELYASKEKAKKNLRGKNQNEIKTGKNLNSAKMSRRDLFIPSVNF